MGKAIGSGFAGGGICGAAILVFGVITRCGVFMVCALLKRGIPACDSSRPVVVFYLLGSSCAFRRFLGLTWVQLFPSFS